MCEEEEDRLVPIFTGSAFSQVNIVCIEDIRVDRPFRQNQSLKNILCAKNDRIIKDIDGVWFEFTRGVVTSSELTLLRKRPGLEDLPKLSVYNIDWQYCNKMNLVCNSWGHDLLCKTTKLIH